MSSPQPITFVEGNIAAEGSVTGRLKLVSPWLLLYGGSTLETGLDLRAIESTFQAKVDWRLAAVDPNFPEAWEGAGSYVGGTPADSPWSATYTPDASDLANNMWVQIGVWTLLTTGSTPANALARAWASVVGTGWIVARQRVQIEQGASSAYVPLGAPFACAGVSGLMHAAIVTGFTGDSTPTLALTGAFRKFKTGDPTMPGAWGDLDTVTFSADGRQNLTTAAATTTSAILAQAGMKYTVGGGFKSATVDIIVAAKK